MQSSIRLLRRQGMISMEARSGERSKASLAKLAARALFPAPYSLTACQPGVLDPVGPIGSADKTILIDSLAIMLAIVVPTILATFAFAWRFRASNTRATYRPEFVYSCRID